MLLNRNVLDQRSIHPERARTHHVLVLPRMQVGANGDALGGAVLQRHVDRVRAVERVIGVAGAWVHGPRNDRLIRRFVSRWYSANAYALAGRIGLVDLVGLNVSVPI